MGPSMHLGKSGGGLPLSTSLPLLVHPGSAPQDFGLRQPSTAIDYDRRRADHHLQSHPLNAGRIIERSTLRA